MEQRARLGRYATTMEPAIDESVVVEDSEVSSISSEFDLEPQSRTFHGSQSTWRQLTREERLVSTSLARVRDQDLSSHLYNSHVMKHRHYILNENSERKLDPWVSKDAWWRKDGDKSYGDEEVFVPFRAWTAWPLPADVVPRAGEQIGPVDEDEKYTFKRLESVRPSSELEDVLTGTTLRIAKEILSEREWEVQRSRTEEKVINRRRSITRSDKEDEDMLDAFETRYEGFRKDVSEPPPRGDVEFQHPVVSADDEKARKLLHPTVRHILSKLDELLMAFHHARRSCVHYGLGQSGPQTQTEVDDESISDGDDEDSSQPQTTDSTLPTLSLRKRGRPSKVLIIPDDVEGSATEKQNSQNDSKRGRPKKARTILPGETYNEMLVRIARLQNQKLPFQSTSNSRPSSSHGRPPHKRTRYSRGKEPHQKVLARLNLRDWSEVLGTAALVGLPPAAIMRATQRCANLFGEGMALHSLVENPTATEKDDETTIYVPEDIPDLGDESLEEIDNQDAVARLNIRTLRRRTLRTQSLKPEGNEDDEEVSGAVEDVERFWCSFHDCPRREEGFKTRAEIFSHLKKAHKLEGNELGDALEGSDDEMLGGVHVDGFLRNIKARHGWRGRSTRQKSIIESRRNSSGEGQSEPE